MNRSIGRTSRTCRARASSPLLSAGGQMRSEAARRSAPLESVAIAVELHSVAGQLPVRVRRRRSGRSTNTRELQHAGRLRPSYRETTCAMNKEQQQSPASISLKKSDSN
ncbi:hypothetical protein PBY51_001286 [Eleginops maclovinus]|uniref:Uncharacterized protein n=1 Tax=Eleginops maclovinus TaxID=56733 RepID=A0AAN7WX52_ELEMC|nr:hypothetical protein PBY51_001286 [Eleginops maclovinus]